MVYRLRNKFVKIVMLSSLAVFVLLFLILYVTTTVQTNSSLDMFADLISQNDGLLPRFDDKKANFDALHSGPERMNPEAAFSTRFFFVRLDRDGTSVQTNISSVASISEEEAEEFAQKALAKGRKRGWMGDYRYKVCKAESGREVIFINGADEKNMNRKFLLTTAGEFAGSMVVILILVVFFSGRAVKPIAESYRKQKQFITDANHELKTPLTLIRTDLELAKEELGENEWLEDIKDASENMTELVGKLITLARMDEEDTQLLMSRFDLSEVISDASYVFEQLTLRRGLALQINVAQGVSYTGDEAAIRQLISILLDNAVKYCDPGGKIDVTLTAGKHPVLTVDNSFLQVKETDLEHLFDRFYRSDKARTAGSGYGIGLSIAQAIVEKHHGQIQAQNLGDTVIRFWVRL